MKVHKKPCHTVFGLNVAGRLVHNAFYAKLTEDQVRISLKRDIYAFSVIFHSLPLSSWKFTKFHIRWSNGYFFIIENIQIHHCICLLLILPFEIDFALSGICFLRKCDLVTFSRNMIFLKEVSIIWITITWYFYKELAHVSFYMLFVTFLFILKK
jgi:hypothetical protein